MSPASFDRLKKLAKKEGKIIFADNDDVFVILPLLEYEVLVDGLYGEECDDENCDCRESRDFDFGEDKQDETKDDEADKDLIRKVNEDIAKWREEQSQKTQEQEKTVIASPSEGAAISLENEKDEVLTEEERYYLEPLE